MLHSAVDAAAEVVSSPKAGEDPIALATAGFRAAALRPAAILAMILKKYVSPHNSTPSPPLTCHDLTSPRSRDRCVNHGSTSNNENFNNVLHMFVSKRIVFKAYALRPNVRPDRPWPAAAPCCFWLYAVWNEQKSMRTVIGATWKAARTGARKNAVVPKAFQAKRKDDTSWSFVKTNAKRFGRSTKTRRTFAGHRTTTLGSTKLRQRSTSPGAAPSLSNLSSSQAIR